MGRWGLYFGEWRIKGGKEGCGEGTEKE